MFLAAHDRAKAIVRYRVNLAIKGERFSLFNGHDFDGGYPHDFADQQTACTTARIEADKLAALGPYPVQRSIGVQRVEQHGDKVGFDEIMTFKIAADSQTVELVAEVLP